MRVSEKAKLLFIHIPKNAGRSVWEMMEKQYPDTRKIAWGHARLKDAPKKYRKKLNKYTTFAIVRNPWDRMVSLYHFLYQQKKSFMCYDGVERPTSIIPELGFEKWLLGYGKVAHRTQRLITTQTPQLDWLIVNHQMKCDIIVRFETLYEDLHKVIEFDNEDFPCKHKSKRGQYQDMYNDKTDAFIRKHFKKDIEYFGYQF